MTAHEDFERDIELLRFTQHLHEYETDDIDRILAYVNDLLTENKRLVAMTMPPKVAARLETAERENKRLRRFVKHTRKAILDWANSKSGEDVDYQLSRVLETANNFLAAWEAARGGTA